MILTKQSRKMQKKKGIEECSWDVFTQEILPRLPGKDLQKLKSVCKNWFRIISSPYFGRVHLNTYNHQSRIRVLIMPQGISERMEEYKCKCDDDDEEEINEFPVPPLFCTSPSTILGSCDGLLCLLLQGTTIVVYNPSTAKVLLYQCPNYTIPIQFCWFGHHPSSGEYVLVLGLSLPYSCCELGVYKFSCNSVLKLIHSTLCWIHPTGERGILLHGALHWPALLFRPHSRRAYHLDNNEYLEISPPAPVECNFKLGVNAEGCLFVIFKQGCKFEMWIMKEYGVQQSWTKYANIQLGFNRLSPLGFFPNGDLILDVDKSQLIKYSFNHEKAELLMIHGSGEAIMCADGLLSPKIVREGGVE